MNIAAIRADIAAAVRSADAGLTVYDVVQPSPHLPAAHVGPPTSIDYHTTYGNGRRLTLRVTLEVDRTDHKAAQRRLDTYLSWPGVPSAIEAHTSDHWSSCKVTGVAEPRQGPPDEPPSLLVDLTLTVTS